MLAEFLSNLSGNKNSAKRRLVRNQQHKFPKEASNWKDHFTGRLVTVVASYLSHSLLQPARIWKIMLSSLHWTWGSTRAWGNWIKITRSWLKGRKMWTWALGKLDTNLIRKAPHILRIWTRTQNKTSWSFWIGLMMTKNRLPSPGVFFLLSAGLIRDQEILLSPHYFYHNDLLSPPHHNFLQNNPEEIKKSFSGLYDPWAAPSLLDFKWIWGTKHMKKWFLSKDAKTGLRKDMSFSLTFVATPISWS